MAGDDEAKPEAGAEAEAEAATTSSSGPLEVGLHAVARTLQLQHGLRHGDYQRYRRYCTRRLRRLRLHAKLTHSHGTGGAAGKRGGPRQPKPFQARPVTLEALLGEKGKGLKEEHLLLLLLGAERAWGMAMQLKQDHAGAKTGMPSRVRNHVIRRLRRAAACAAQLKALCQAGPALVAERTALEAEAYSAGMGALLALEQEKWGEALAGLRVAHSVLGRFAEMPGASLHDQDLFALKADEALQSMRYCQFQLGGDGAAGSQQLLQDLSRADQQHHHLPPALRDKLEAALAGARREAASSMAEVTWGSGQGGLRIPVSSEAVRVALLKLNEAKAATAGAGAGGGEAEGEEEAAVSAVFGAYSEALQAVQQELARVQGEGSGPRAEAQRAELRLLSAYLQHGRLETTMRRTKSLVARLEAGGGDGVGGAQGEKEREAELVHLFETLGQGAGEAVRLLSGGGGDGVEAPEEVLTVAQAEEACFRAHRALHLALFYAASASSSAPDKGGQQQQQQEQLAQALALFDRAGALAEEAEALAEEVDARADKARRQGLVDEAAGLRARAEGGRVRAQALALLASLEAAGGEQQKQSKGAPVKEEEALASAMAALSLAAKAGGASGGGGGGGGKRGGGKAGGGGLHRTLLERLGDLDGGRESEGFAIARVPPTVLAAVRGKPPLFDMAYNFLLDQRLPDLAERAGLPPAKAKRKPQQQGGGGLFGWLRG